MVNTVRLEPLPYFALGDKMLLQLSSSMFLPKMVWDSYWQLYQCIEQCIMNDIPLSQQQWKYLNQLIV